MVDNALPNTALPYTPLEVRNILRISQAHLALGMNISQAQYSKLENLQRKWTLEYVYNWKAFIDDQLELYGTPKEFEWSRMPDYEDFREFNKDVSWGFMLLW